MARNLNNYQYETSPRKLEPNYTPSKKNNVKKKQKAKKNINKKKDKKQQMKIIVSLTSAFLILFAISYRNAKIDENFAKMKDLEKELDTIEKQNTQMEIAIETNLNLTTIEEQAKERLGMQVLNNKQTVYVDLPKSDYVEAAAEEVKIEENSIKDKIFKVLNQLFK